MLQYQVFCERVHAEVDRIVQGLRQAGVPTKLQFQAAGGNGRDFIKDLQDQRVRPVGGEALIRLDNRYVCHLQMATCLVSWILFSADIPCGSHLYRLRLSLHTYHKLP